MSSITKLAFIIAFAALLSVATAYAADSAPDANDSVLMPSVDGGNDGRDESVAGGSRGESVPRSEALEFAQPATDASSSREDVVNQPSMGRNGVVSDPALAMPAGGSGNEGRDQSVLGD